jgi:hypothetical protein
MKSAHDLLTQEVLLFLEASGMRKTSFGLAVANDGHLVNDIIKGRKVNIDKAANIRAFIDENVADESNTNSVAKGHSTS